MSLFWRYWMTGWCVSVGLFGILLVAGGLEATSGPIRIFLELLRGPGEILLDPPMRFSLSVLGAVSMGWSLTLWGAIQAAEQLGEAGRSLWVLITASVVGWYVIDSSLSIATGFGLNAVPNTLYLISFLLPVIRCGVLQAR